MSENPLMALLLGHNSFLGESETVENEITPLPNQLALEPGDMGILASANTQLEHEFCVVKVLDAEKYAETFPDWEERLLNSFLLCELTSRNDLEPYPGWVSRLKILPITEEHYEEALSWQTAGFPDDVPEWGLDFYLDYADALSDQKPDTVPHSVQCKACGSRHVDLVVDRKVHYSCRAGSILIDDKRKIIPLNEVEEQDEHVPQLVCGDCGKKERLNDDQWAFRT
jgi:hypothetical protein